MKKYRVTVKAMCKPHKGKLFTYVLETFTRDEAIGLAKQYAEHLDRVTKSTLYKIEEVEHEAA